MATDYVGTFKIILADVGTEQRAHGVLRSIQDYMEGFLDDDDEVTLTGLIEAPAFMEYASLKQVMQLRQARNVLLALKFTDTYEMASRLDQFQWALGRKMHPDHSDVSQLYDHGNLSSVAEEVWAGKNPLHR